MTPGLLEDQLDSKSLGLYAALHREFYGIWRALSTVEDSEARSLNLPEDWQLPPSPMNCEAARSSWW